MESFYGGTKVSPFDIRNMQIALQEVKYKYQFNLHKIDLFKRVFGFVVVCFVLFVFQGKILASKMSLFGII